jgi:hypothetical protein
MNRGNLGYYNKVMMCKFNIKDVVDVPIELIPRTFKGKVMVSCDICNSESEKVYSFYNQCLDYGFYTCNKCKHVKSKMTNKDKYGLENFVNVEKRIKTMEEKYGFYFNNREKCKETCIDRYGVDNVSKSDIVKKKKIETYNENWGFDNVFQSKDIKIKSEKTMLKKYGVTNALQNPDLFTKSQMTGFQIKKHNLGYYRGTYELDFLNYCENNGIEIEKGPSIKYFFDYKERIYHSDFFIKSKNLICEIKSSYTYNFDKEMNDAKKRACIENGYRFIFIMDKDYLDFSKIIKSI